MSLVRFCQPTNSFWPSLEGVLNHESLPWLPEVDVSEDKEHYTIKADLPGIKKEDIRLSFDDGILTIDGQRQAEAEQKERNYHRVERSYGRFVRSFNLGTDVDANKIQASYKDGVLEITVAKIEKAQPKAIDIKVE